MCAFNCILIGVHVSCGMCYIVHVVVYVLYGVVCLYGGVCTVVYMFRDICVCTVGVHIELCMWANQRLTACMEDEGI